MLNEVNESRTVFLLYELSRVVTFIETESIMAAARLGGQTLRSIVQ